MLKMGTLPSMESMRSLGNRPRVHPNGFIQLDLSDRVRLHVWHPKLPFRQDSYSPVHDHIFSFDSFVFSGRLVHVPYVTSRCENGTHERWQVRGAGPGETTVLENVGSGPERLHPMSAWIVQPGDSYHFEKYVLHETLANEPTMTMMWKEPFDGQKVGTNCMGTSVMVPVGSQPDNEFVREDFPADMLWTLIEEAHP